MRGPIARGTIRTSFVLGLRLLVQAGTLLIVARMLGPHQFGAFAGVAALAVLLGTLSTFGTHLVLLGEMSKDTARRDAILRWAIPATLATGVVMLAVYLTVCYTVLSESGIALVFLIAIGAAETLLQPLVTLLSSEHLARGRIAFSQLLQITAPSMRLIAAAAIFLLAPDHPFSVYAIAYLLASALALFAVLGAAPSTVPLPAQWRMPRTTEIRHAFSFAILNVTKAGPAELDKTLATKLLPLSSAGVYSAAARIVGASALPVIAMTLSSLPRLFRSELEPSHHTGRLLHWMLGVALAYGVALAAMLWICAPVFDWIFGAGYDGISRMLRLLCLAIPALALRLVSGNALMAIGKPWMRAGFEIAGLLVLAVASVWMSQRFGAIGLPLALAASEWSMCLMGIGLVTMVRQQTRHQPHAS